MHARDSSAVFVLNAALHCISRSPCVVSEPKHNSPMCRQLGQLRPDHLFAAGSIDLQAPAAEHGVIPRTHPLSTGCPGHIPIQGNIVRVASNLKIVVRHATAALIIRHRMAIQI